MRFWPGRNTDGSAPCSSETGAPIKSAGPSTPVVVVGLSGTPFAGDDVLAVADERKAREVAEFRQGRKRDVKLAQQQAVTLDDVFSQMTEAKRQASSF